MVCVCLYCRAVVDKNRRWRGAVTMTWITCGGFDTLTKNEQYGQF